MLILAKILTTFLTVVLLAKVAERLGPKYAGLLSGFPLGTGIALYFFGWQQGETFAANSAIYTLAGLSSAIVLAWGYWQILKRFPERRWMPLAMAAAFIAFFAISALLQYLPAWRWLNLVVIAIAILLFQHIFKAIPEVKTASPLHSATDPSMIETLINSPWGGLLLRATLATLTILMITGLADWLGPERAGLMAAFPISFFPLILLLHLTKGAAVVATTIKHYPMGIGSLAVYSLSVSYLYPLLGLNWGTLAALLAACGYLGVYWLISKRV